MTTRPPLNALHFFCVVVREGGFRQAAQALHVTPGAVSRQIQALEENLKEVLFYRGTGNVATLTSTGEQLYDRIAHAMETISDAASGTNRTGKESTILVDTSVTLAMYWLIPHLRHFKERHPNIRVQVRTTDGPINVSTPGDVFIRREPEELRGQTAHIFMAERSVLVSTADIAANLTSRRRITMDWILKVPRISVRSRPDLWLRWGEFHGVDSMKLKSTLGFDNTVLAIQAALQGLGALVVPEMFISGMLSTSSLMLLDESRIDTGTYSYAVGRQRESARVSLFTDWLKQKGGT